MTVQKLRDEIALELRRMGETAREIEDLLGDVGDRDPATREKTAAGAYLVNLYAGIERILLRVLRHRNVCGPEGPSWHQDLLEMFGPSPALGLPSFFDASELELVQPYLMFRHVFVHGYGIDLKWPGMIPGLRQASGVLEHFGRAVEQYLVTCEGLDRL